MVYVPVGVKKEPSPYELGRDIPETARSRVLYILARDTGGVVNPHYDVVVVGAGNAAFCAAQAARELVGRVLVLEKAPERWLGGNTYFTAGAFRVTFGGLEDLRPLLEDADDDRLGRTELAAYGPAGFMADMRRVTGGRCDAELATILVEDSLETVRWMSGKGIRWRLMYDRQSFEVDGKLRFWGGLVLGTVEGGKGLIGQHLASARDHGIDVRCSFAAQGLRQGASGDVVGIKGTGPEGPETIEAGAVVLACGGFESNPEMRSRYLGPAWKDAKVRGTPHNTGEGLGMALEAGAEPYGDWSGCHSIAWDVAAPSTGERGLTNLYSKQSYPIGIVVNAEGRRFLDEGADYRNYTYAKYGAEILRQPGGVAFQLFDAKTEPLLRQDEYTAPGVSRYEAGSIRELAAKMGVEPEALEQTVSRFNSAVQPGKFDPSVKDGKRTEGIEPPKSNWALPLDPLPTSGSP